jgi:hypothetical protein
MIGMDDLIIGTSSGEWKLAPGGQTDTITPTSVKLKQQSSWGCSDIPAQLVGNSIVFVLGSKKGIRDLFYTLEFDRYDGGDLSIQAGHFFETYGIKEWAYQAYPESVIWAVREDGVLVGFTYLREHKVKGWHRHTTDGLFESVACITTSSGVSEVYFVVKRTINGQTKRYIERLNDRIFTEVEDANFLDCSLVLNDPVNQTLTPGASATTQGATGVTFTAGGSIFQAGDIGKQIHYRYYDDDGAFKIARAEITGYTSGTVVTATILRAWPSTTLIASEGWYLTTATITGLSHLEGKTVKVVADGNIYSDLVVSSGSVTVPTQISKAIVGLPYTQDLGTLRYEYQTQQGTVQDKIEQVKSVYVRMRKTRYLKVAPDADTQFTEIKFRTDEDMYEPTRLFTGDKEADLFASTNIYGGKVFFRSDEPSPVTIQSVVARIENGSV